MMEFEDQEEEVPCFDSLDNSNSTWRAKMSSPVEAPTTPLRKPKYKECLKNHAVGIGGHAVSSWQHGWREAWMHSNVLLAIATRISTVRKLKEAGATIPTTHTGISATEAQVASGYLHIAPPQQ
ncbi:zinc-finger homeodomain protein 1-like [Forsythia ovata]|uniref:Zinc-finger homeodomain protein 1-like n=1 Tax=Forsythia ovata TaxID=205694 RepID=A0ABD1TQC7_9LAMI